MKGTGSGLASYLTGMAGALARWQRRWEASCLPGGLTSPSGSRPSRWWRPRRSLGLHRQLTCGRGGPPRPRGTLLAASSPRGVAWGTGPWSAARRARRQGDRGDAIVVWCLLTAILLLPLGGLSVDLWHGIAVQRKLQSAAEDAAAAGASGIDVAVYRQSGCVLLDPSVAVLLAEENLAQQAGLGPLAAEDISVAPNRAQITVVLREAVHLTLLKLVEGDRPLVVAASATSEPRGSLSGEGCSQ